MDITGHVQSMWNYYQEAVEELGENAPNFSMVLALAGDSTITKFSCMRSLWLF